MFRERDSVKSTSEHLSATPVQCDHSNRDLINKEFNSIIKKMHCIPLKVLLFLNLQSVHIRHRKGHIPYHIEPFPQLKNNSTTVLRNTQQTPHIQRRRDHKAVVQMAHLLPVVMGTKYIKFYVTYQAKNISYHPNFPLFFHSLLLHSIT